MLEFITNRLSTEMLVTAIVVTAALLVFAVRHPDVCFVLGFPALLYLGQLREVYPISVSAGAAVFPFVAFAGALLKRGQLHFGSCQKVLIALGILMLVSVNYSASRTYGMEKTVLFWFMVLPVVVFAPTVIRTNKAVHLTLSVVLISLIVYIFTSAVLLPSASEEMGRVAALHDVTVAGQYLSVAIIIFLIRIVIGRERAGVKIIFASLATVAFALLLKTGTRSPFLAIVLSVPFLAWFTYAEWWPILRRAPAKIYGGAIAAVLLGLIAFSFAPEMRDRFLSLETFFSDFTPDQLYYWDSSRSRALNYTVALKSFASKPLWGLGVGGYKNALAQYLPHYFPVHDQGVPSYPHNILLEFGVEQGVLSLLLIISVFHMNLRMIFALKKAFDHMPSQRLPIASCVGFFIIGLVVSMTALDVPRMMVLWWGMGLLLAAHNVYTPVRGEMGAVGLLRRRMR